METSQARSVVSAAAGMSATVISVSGMIVGCMLSVGGIITAGVMAWRAMAQVIGIGA